MGAVDGAFKKFWFLAQSWVGVNFEVETITFLAVDIRGRVTSSVAMHLIPLNLREKLTPEYVLYVKSHAAVAVSKLISEVRML